MRPCRKHPGSRGESRIRHGAGADKGSVTGECENNFTGRLRIPPRGIDHERLPPRPVSTWVPEPAGRSGVVVRVDLGRATEHRPTEAPVETDLSEAPTRLMSQVESCSVDQLSGVNIRADVLQAPALGGTVQVNGPSKGGALHRRDRLRLTLPPRRPLHHTADGEHGRPRGLLRAHHPHRPRPGNLRGHLPAHPAIATRARRACAPAAGTIAYLGPDGRQYAAIYAGVGGRFAVSLTRDILHLTHRALDVAGLVSRLAAGPGHEPWRRPPRLRSRLKRDDRRRGAPGRRSRLDRLESARRHQ
jgi:hypothetical protein